MFNKYQDKYQNKYNAIDTIAHNVHNTEVKIQSIFI